MKFNRTALILFLTSTVFLLSAQNFSPSLYDSLQQTGSKMAVGGRSHSLRMKLIWDDGNIRQEFQATVRIKHDSLIWMSAGTMGVEGIRTLFTRDSLFFINRLTHEYAVHPIGFIQNWMLFPISYKMLQQMLMGEKLDIQPRAATAMTEDSMYVMYEETDKLKQTVWVDTGNYTLRKILLKDKLLQQDMTITFDGYNSIQGIPFSYKRSIIIARGETVIELDMNILKVNGDEELLFPFEISDKYKRIE